MLKIDNANFEFSHMGYFTTENTWIHPPIIQNTYQLILVTEGIVHIYENEKFYDLVPGNIILLQKNMLHYGYMPSREPTSFYWLHFRCDDIMKLELPIFTESYDKLSVFKELLHQHCSPNCPQITKDSTALYLLSKIRSCAKSTFYTNPQSRLANEIFEWTKINANAKLTVAMVAEHFRYSPEHITRLIKKYYHSSMKDIINNFIINNANSLLCNSNYSIKEIATNLNFNDSNSFVKFYKYHEHISPTKFRDSYSKTHMNKK